MSSLGHALLVDIVTAMESDPALASRLRDAIGAGAADEWLDRQSVEERYPIRFRVLVDAARRDRIELGGTPRRPLVRRAELERFLQTRRTFGGAAASPLDEAQASLDRCARRFERRRE